METIIPGFESEYRTRNEPGGGGPGFGSDPEGPNTNACWEVMAAHINFNVTTKTYKPGRHSKPVTEETGWSTSGSSYLYYAPQLSDGRFGVPRQATAQIIKQCVCLTSKESGWINFFTMGAINVPYNGGAWKTEKWMLSKIKEAFAMKGVQVSDSVPRTNDTMKDHYIYSSFVKSCKPCKIDASSPPVANCPCDDSYAVTLDLNDKSKFYVDSAGNKTTFSNPGNRQSVIKEVMAAEQAISLQCGPEAS
tara:strand:+ start:29 stop:775 length:747 start_codon:yes stop_codon:yes gene_type:complete